MADGLAAKKSAWTLCPVIVPHVNRTAAVLVRMAPYLRDLRDIPEFQ